MKKSHVMDPYVKKLHEADLKFPAYCLGYKSKKYDSNPYEYPDEICMQRLKLSIKKLLTVEDKIKLQFLNDEIGRTKWSQWSRGHYRKNRY